jgi:tripartite-type tricarboxylate transporter receptor subunit TctC
MMRTTLHPSVALLVTAAATVPLPALGAQAQTYPTKPVRMVVGFPPGGAVDIVARVIGKKLAENMNVPFVVDNRPGAASAIGAEITAKAPPDGYTVFLTAGSIAINVGLQKHPPYDPVKDFAAVSLVASTPNVLVVQPSLPVKTVADLIKLARAKPGQLNFGSGGSGTMTHLSGELLKVMTGIQLTHVAYKGAPLAVVDVMAGQIQMAFGALPGALPQIRAGQVRAIAVTTTKRSPSAPEIPTVAESGVPGYEASNWYGVLAPAATPAPVVTRLNGEIARALHDAEVGESLRRQGLEPLPSMPDEFARYLKSEIAKWAKVIRAAGLRPE